ncbi:MAG: diguanylate cyclase [Actinomycetota bacterium]
MSTSSENRASPLLGMLAAALAVVAIAAAIMGMARDLDSLGMIAAAIAAVLAAAVVWLSSTNSSLSTRLAEQDLQLARLESGPALAERVAAEIAGSAATPEPEPQPVEEEPAPQNVTPIRTPAGELTGLDIGDTSDLADPDTGLLGERYFVVTLEARVAAARRHLRPLALVLLEAVTEAAGSATPIDANLAADVVRETLRDADTLCRLQSGRFAILLEDTPENGAIWTVERIRRRLGEQLDDVTVWAGIACYPANGFDGPEVLDRAREALTQAREWRQDRTEVADT